MPFPKRTEKLNEICQRLFKDAGININGKKPWDIQVNNMGFYRRCLQDASLGLGESYMDGWWDCERIDMLITALIESDIKSSLSASYKDLLRVASSKLINFQSHKRAWIVGKEHYDLGNDLFSEMLDPWMLYSCAYWKNATNLDAAQENKLKLICEKLQLKEGMSLLDIGCGWGGLSEYAARNYNVKVTGITISNEQRKLAQKRCADLDVEILLMDYRDLNKKFDRIVSVGMFEHVGPKNYKNFFDVVTRCLVKEGVFLLHTIGSNRTDASVDPWINKYIFPNGCIPSLGQISLASEKSFIIEDLHNFGSDYDLTLMAWYRRFYSSWPKLSDKYSERFKRMFTFYLNACAGAFRARDLQLWQICFTKGLKGGIIVPR